MRTNRKIQSLALGLLMCMAPVAASAGVAISITIAPPELPVYVQPACPHDGYLWTPGYWAYGPVGYYWVPGVWIAPPRFGVLWTPGYWGFEGGGYFWHAGYWGPHVGFYGGVNYGFGYAGVGFFGGVWAGNVFRYNTAVVRVDSTVVRNVYVDRTVINNTNVFNRASFNGPGGVRAQPTAQEQGYMREAHTPAMQTQVAHEQTASRDPAQRASKNGAFSGATAMDSVNGRHFNTQGRVANAATPGPANAGGMRAPQQRPQVNQPQHNASQANYTAPHNTANAPNAGKPAPPQRPQVSQKQNAPGKAAANEKREEKK